MFIRMKNDQGNITLIALMLLAVLTLMGVSVSRTSSIDMQIARNEIPFKQNFYVAEGGLNREAAEIGSGEYVVLDIGKDDELLADQDGLQTGGGGLLPGPDHKVGDKKYDFELWYNGYYPPPRGYSILDYSRYDFYLDVRGGDTDQVRVASRYYKIGPKAE